MPDTQQESREQEGMPYSIRDTGKADLLDKIRPDIPIEELRHRLMGERFDEEDGKWKIIAALKTDALSEQGAWEICNLLMSVSNQNTSLSNLNDDEIKLRSLALVKIAIKKMLCSWKEYNITTIDKMKYIAEIVYTVTYIVLKQPEKEGIRRLIMGVIEERRAVMDHNISESKRFNVLDVFKKR